MLIWDGEEPGDERYVMFSHREVTSLAASTFMPTLQWLGDEGFELVSQQIFPINIHIDKTNFGEYAAHPVNRQVMSFKRPLPSPAY